MINIHVLNFCQRVYVNWDITKPEAKEKLYQKELAAHNERLQNIILANKSLAMTPKQTGKNLSRFKK